MMPNHYFADKYRIPSREHGVVLIITLIALTLLLLTTIALFRSSGSSLLQAGSIGYQRDLENQAELGIQAALAQIKNASGVLNSPTMRNSDLLSANYSAVRLTSSRYGVPDELLDFNSRYINSANKIAGSNGTVVNYLIDRLCDRSAQGQTPSNNICLMLPPSVTSSGQQIMPESGSQLGVTGLAIYRISVRVDGSKGSQIFVQTTVAF